eukprot:sb/3467967/
MQPEVSAPRGCTMRVNYLPYRRRWPYVGPELPVLSWVPYEMVDCQGSIDSVTGYPTRVIMALKKGAAIGNEVVRNRKLSLSESQPTITPQNQRCNGRGCKTCPILFETPQTVVVNGSCLKLDLRLTCKSSGVIYVANCVICGESYFGQTHSALHIRMNGHRSKFKTDQLAFEQSALSYHCFLKYRDKDNFSISSFRIGLVKRASPMELDRVEEFFIESFGTRVNGLNRIAVVRWQFSRKAFTPNTSSFPLKSYPNPLNVSLHAGWLNLNSWDSFIQI